MAEKKAMLKLGHVIWINGFPGVGKYTIAKELHRLIPGSVLLDNHSLIDLVTLARDHPDYNGQREEVRDAAYARLVYPATDEESECGNREEQLSRVVIFTGKMRTLLLLPFPMVLIRPYTVTLVLTRGLLPRQDCFTDGTIGTKWSTAPRTAAEKAGRPFLPVYLACEREENLKRVMSAGRQTGDRKKLTDVKMVEDFLDKLKTFRFADLGVDVDVTELTAEEAAKRIIEAMEE